MKLPYVSRLAFEMAIDRASRAEARAICAEAEVQRLTDTIVRFHEAVIAPKPVTVQPVSSPDFQQFPPVVAAALAIATAGFKRDQQREIYAWAEAELTLGRAPDEVADVLKHGLSVEIDKDEAH